MDPGVQRKPQAADLHEPSPVRRSGLTEALVPPRSCCGPRLPFRPRWRSCRLWGSS